MRLRFWKRGTAKSKSLWIVQLHRATATDDDVSIYDGGFMIASSWAPIECRNEGEAFYTALRLRADNKWGSAVYWPYVTITDPEGTTRSDAYYWNKRQEARR